MRSKRPPAMSFLLRMDTARRAGRVVSLLALDFVGVALAIFTALVLKEVVLRRRERARRATKRPRHFVPFAYLLTALLFARSGLYAARSQRPGLSRIVGSLFQVACVALMFAVVSGEQFSSFYIFYGSLAFALLYVSSLRAGYEAITGVALRAAGYRRRAMLVGTGKHIRDVAHALGEASASRAAGGRRLHLAEPAAGERAALAGNARRPGRGAPGRADRRGDHRRLGLPPGRGGRARRSAATGAGCACGSRRRRWRS